MTSSLSQMYEQAFAAIEQAKSSEKRHNLKQAQQHYVSGITIFMKVLKLETNANKKKILNKHVLEFMSKAEQLKSIPNPSAPPSEEPAPQSSTNTSFLDFDLPDPPSTRPIMPDLPDPPSHINKNKRRKMNGNNSGGGGGGPVIHTNFDPSSDETPLQKAQSVLDEAIECDQSKHYMEAMQYYTECSQLFLNCMKPAMNAQSAFMTDIEKNEIRKKVQTVLNRIETLDRLILKQQKESANALNSNTGSNTNNNSNNSNRARNRNSNRGVADEGLSNREIEILRRSSYIRDIILYPWMEADKHSQFDYGSTKFKDALGLLSLSAKQKSKFGKWRRVSALSAKPRVVAAAVTPYSITQTLITDCSFVSSLTVTALYEKIFGKQLITAIIYPQDAQSGMPVYNASGKYVVKLFLNGCYRKIEIDDYLPVANASYGEKLLCSYSNNTDEFWVSILEKAFLKVMGGYDFPGSTSCEDLHVLTGWIPERVGLKNEDLDVERLFDRLVSGAKFGDCLITIASRDIPEDEADRVGIVPSHAYAVLRVVKLGSHKFLLIKNPWAQTRWKGRFSADDAQHWTPQLRAALNYNPDEQKQFDNGIFWMELTDVRQYYSAIYMNWNPELFKHRITQHEFWSKKIGPKNDSYNLGYNPQFALDVDLKAKNGICWILLSKHMENTKREEQDKNDFLTLHVYDESAVNTRDRRVFHRKGALHTGTYINSPHYLLKIDVDSNTSKSSTDSNTNNNSSSSSSSRKVRRYTIIVSQYEKKNDVAFTITAYSTLSARFRPIDDRTYWTFRRVLTGAWTREYSGGCPNFPSFPKNPQFRITVDYDKTQLRFMLEAPIDYSVNVQCYLCTNAPKDERSLSYAEPQQNADEMTEEERNACAGKIITKEHYRKALLVADSGTYRHALTLADVTLDEGVYIIIISTFKPEQIGGFKLTVAATEDIKLKYA